MTAKEQKKAATDFAAKWAGKGYEKGKFKISLLVLLVVGVQALFGVGLPSVVFVDTEVSTNVALNAGTEGVERIAMELVCLTTPTNNVQAAFGVDGDDDGVLQPSEAAFVVGWDCGAWFVQQGCDGERIEFCPAVTNSSGGMVFTMKAGAEGAHRRVEAIVDGYSAFEQLAQETPPWLRLHGVNMVRLTGRGLDAHDEVFNIRGLRDALTIRFR